MLDTPVMANIGCGRFFMAQSDDLVELWNGGFVVVFAYSGKVSIHDVKCSSFF